MRINISTVLSAFNSESGAEVKHDRATAMVAFADVKSAYGRAVRDITVVALSGRWRDDKGEIVSDNMIGHAFGIPVRQPRARLTALTASGLVFQTDADITANAAVWAHVSKMYNAGKDGRDVLKATAETIAAVPDVDDKRAMWLATPIPARQDSTRAAKPNDGTTGKDDTDALSESDAEAGNVPTDTTERFPIAEAETSTLLSYIVAIGTELTNRFPDMSTAERNAFKENLALLTQSTEYAVKKTAKK
jgi:hypothetical protein